MSAFGYKGPADRRKMVAALVVVAVVVLAVVAVEFGLAVAWPTLPHFGGPGPSLPNHCSGPVQVSGCG